MEATTGELGAKFAPLRGRAHRGLAPSPGKVSVEEMKTPVVCVAVLFAVGHSFAASTGITLVQQPKPPSAVKPDDQKPADSTPPPVVAPPVKKVEKPKAPKEPVIPGMTLVRPNGTFIGFEAVGGKFKLSFYDKKKKPMAVDVDGGLAHWANTRGPGDIRSPLSVSGTALISAKPAIPPFNFNVYITLLKGEGESAKAVETYTVQFRG
jgi:hypothetical protein